MSIEERTLSEILIDLCARLGLDADEASIRQLDDVVIVGYRVAEPRTIEAAATLRGALRWPNK